MRNHWRTERRMPSWITYAALGALAVVTLAVVADAILIRR